MYEIVPVTRFKQNCSIVWCERTHKAAIIDPGGDLPDILLMLELLELQPDLALITHGHPDHCGAAARFAELTGARIMGPHRADRPLIQQLGNQSADSTAIPQGRAASLDENGSRSSMRSIPQTAETRCFEPDGWLKDGDSIGFGDEQLEVLHCPGHSPGHVAYFSRAGRQAFVGDILFRGAIGAWAHPYGSLPDLVRSIRSKLFPLGDDVSFVPGHGGTSTFGHERQHNGFVGDVAFARWSKMWPS